LKAFWRGEPPLCHVEAEEHARTKPATVRDIELGRDTKLTTIEAIAVALGQELDLVEVDV